MRPLHPLFLLPASLLGFGLGSFFSAYGKRAPLALGPASSSRSKLIPEISSASWEKFVGVMCLAPKTHVSPKGRLGTFQMDARRLKDVGLMRTAEKGKRAGVSGVWVGQWLPPLTEDKFLGSMPLQYAAFVRSMAAAAPKVSGYVGREVVGVRCSLSGLLGVSHAAGEGGVESWVRGDKRFPSTTEMFSRTNSIF